MESYKQLKCPKIKTAEKRGSGTNIMFYLSKNAINGLAARQRGETGSRRRNGVL